MVDARRRHAATLLLVNFRPEYRADWMQKSWYRQIAAGAARRARRSPSCSPICSATIRASPALAERDPRAHRRQSVLHRGGRPVAGRVGASRRATRGAYRLVDAVERLDGAGDRAGGARGAHRSAAGAREAVLQTAAVIGKDVPRAAPGGASRSCRADELRGGARGAARAPSSSTSRRSTRWPSTPSSIR